MCGILGVASREDFAHLEKMNGEQFHRGPDEGGVHLDPETGAALAMRRLSIIDLSGGKQPMSNEDDTIWVVCNGEIFNAPELMRGLVAKGHTFKSRNSDTEVLLHLYEEMGTELVQRLNGMYAFVLYDSRKKILFGARDRMGIKPLYYSARDGRFAFASELKSLQFLPWVSKEIDHAALSHFLSFQFVPAPDSIYRDVMKLPAGHCFTFDLRSRALAVKRYWKLHFDPAPPRSRSEWKEILRAKLEECIRRWTLSDVPISCSLSGGLDSSCIVGILAKLGHTDLSTYSLGFSGPGMSEYNELDLARNLAKTWGTVHHELILDPKTLLSDLRKMVWHLDEPYAGGLPSWYVYRLVAERHKVVLTGSGGDELFGNYGKWSIFERGLSGRAGYLRRELAKWKDPKAILSALKHPHGFLYHRYLSDAAKEEMLAPSRNGGWASSEALLECFWKESGQANPRNAVAYVDFQLQLPEEFLMVTDRFSMAHSVEARVPFLDHEMVELAFTVPPDVRTASVDFKGLLREMVADVLPPEYLTAPKRGFVLPLPMWTRNELKPLIRELLGPEALAAQKLLSPSVWDKVVEPHLENRADFTPQVWTLMMFQLWRQTYAS